MKQLLFIFLLFSLCCPAQNDLALYPGKIPPGAKPIALPLAKLSDFSGRSTLVTTDSAYKALFHDSVHYRLPAIDFARYELHGRAGCAQCIAVCGSRPGCHRNACRYTRSWYLLDKTPWQEIHANTVVVVRCYPGKENAAVNDSAYAALALKCPELNHFTPGFDSSTVLVRSRFADGCAVFAHTFLLDTVAHTLTWRTRLTPGGCRGGNSNFFVAALPRLPEGYTVLFEEYTMPRRE